MTETTAAIFKRSDLKEESKSKNLHDIVFNDLLVSDKKFFVEQSIVLFIDDNQQTRILKNKHGDNGDEFYNTALNKVRDHIYSYLGQDMLSKFNSDLDKSLLKEFLTADEFIKRILLKWKDNLPIRELYIQYHLLARIFEIVVLFSSEVDLNTFADAHSDLIFDLIEEHPKYSIMLFDSVSDPEKIKTFDLTEYEKIF